MENLFGIGILLDYQDRASAKMLKTQRIFSQTQQTAEQLAEAVEKNNEKFKKLAGISSGVALAGAGLKASGGKLLGVLGKAVEETKSFETALVNLKIVSGETEEGMERLKKIAIDTGMATMFSPQETVDALTSLAAAGLDVESSLTALRPTLDLVSIAAGKIDLVEGASLIASSLNKFNLEASEAVRLVDMFVKVSNLTNFQLEDMSAFINSLGTAPTKLGRPMEELLAMGGLLRNIGQQSAQAGATVQGFGRQLILITQQLERGKGMKVDALKELGISADDFWDAEGKMKSMMEIFERLTEASANLTDEKRATLFQRIFGDQAGNMLNAVMRSTEAFMKLDEATGQYVSTSTEGKRAFQDIVDGLKDSVGVSKQASEDILDTLWGIQKINEGIRQTFQVLLGQTVIPIIGKVTKFFSNLLSKIVEFGYAHPVFMKTLGYGLGLTGLVLTAVGTLLVLGGALGGAIAGLGFLQGKVATLATSWLGLNANMLTGTGIMTALWLKMRPLVTQAGALALTLGALYLAWKFDFGGIKTIITDFIDNTRHAFTEARRIIGLNTDEMLTAVKRLEQKDDFFSKLTVGLVKLDTLWRGLSEAWNDYTLSEDTFVRLRELGLLPLVETVLDLKMKFEAFWEGFTGGLETVSEKTRTIVEKISEVVGGLIDKVRGFFNPAEETEGKIEDINTAVGGLDTSKWESFGNVVGIIVGILGASKIVERVGKIGKAVFSLGKPIISVGKWVLGLGKNISGAGIVSALETIYLKGLMAIDALKVGIPKLFPLLTGLGKGFLAVGKFILANPIVLVIAGIIAGIVLLVKNWDKIKEKTLEVWGMITEKIGSAKDKIVEVMGNMKERIINAWESVKERIGTVVEGIKTFVTERIPEIITNIVDWFKELPDKIGYAIGFVVGRIARWVVDTIELVRTRVPEIIETVVNFFRELPGKIYEKISETYNKITEWASNMLTIATEKVSEIVEAVRLFFSELPEKIYGAISGAYERVVGWASNMVATVREQVPIIIDKVVTFFSELPGKIYDKVSEVIGKVVQWKDDMIETIKTEVPKIISKIVEFFEELPGKVLEIGGNIVTGLWEGIWGKVEWLKDKVGNFVGNVIQGFKDGFQTKSPSRIMELEIGQWLPAGLAKGIEGNKGILDKTVTSYMIEPVVTPVKGIVEYISKVDVPTIKPLRGLIEYETNEPAFKPLDKSKNISETLKELPMSREYVGKTEDNSVVFEKGAIQIIVEKGTEEDAERFAEMIMKKIEKKKQLQRTMNYGMQPV